MTDAGSVDEDTDRNAGGLGLVWPVVARAPTVAWVNASSNPLHELW